MQYPLLVGTYHKTGTVWMLDVFTQLANALEVPFYNVSNGYLCNNLADKRDYIERALASDEKCIIYDFHTRFDLAGLDVSRLRGMRVVRDPRDVLLSATRYHSWSEEEWLHESRPQFDGMSYAEKLNSLSSLDEQMRFEMGNACGGQIRLMSDFEGFGAVRAVHYEQLMADKDLMLWHELMLFLGLEGSEIPMALQAFWDNSLFGGKRPDSHVQDGSSRQFEKRFSAEMTAEFEQRFGTALVKLGYA